LHNIGAALLISIVIGFVAGVVVHGMPRVRRSLEPVLTSYYALPFFVLYPLLIVLLGMNNLPIIVVASLYAVVAMLTNTLSGLDRIPVVLSKVGRNFRLGRVQTALRIQLPATLPYLFTGARLVLGYAIAGVIGSEFILSGAGVGYSIAFAYNNFDNATMYALLLFVILVVTLLLTLLNVIERRAHYVTGSGWATAPSPLPRGTPLERFIEGFLVLVSIVGVWQLLHLYVGGEALASPLTTVQRIGSLSQSREFWNNVTETARALGISLVISFFGGAFLGIVLGTRRLAGAIFEPMIVTLQSVPKVTLYPVMLLIFGLGIAAKVAFGAIHGIIPMTLITMNGIRSINPALKRTARVLHLTPVQTAFTVLLPATVPEFITGMRFGFSLTFLGVMVGEMFASKRGLGYMIMSGIETNDVSTMLAVTVLIGTFAIVVNGLLLAFDKRVRG
jgi:NitT/TauT family transport system permease protein